MLRGYYTAASGMASQERRLNAIANNIANATKGGYKKDDIVFSTFGEHLAVRQNRYPMAPLNRIGGGEWMVTTDDKFTSFRQGDFEFTGRPLDFCIQGEGFFVVDTEQGERLTRDGQFALDEEGYLILPGIGRVQGQNGDIRMLTEAEIEEIEDDETGRSDFFVTEYGHIYLPPEEEGDEPTLVDRLTIAMPEDYAALEKEPNGLFFAPDGYQTLPEEGPVTGVVLQQQIEKSNVNMGEEMTRMIAAQRSLQSASQLVRMYDQMAEEGTSTLSRIR